MTYMIGLFGGFDQAKFNRDFRPGFGIEACMFPSEDDLIRLKDAAKTYKFKWGAHFPLINDHEQYRDPMITSTNKAVRRHAYDRIERDCALVACYGGRYLLIHGPKPNLIPSGFPIDCWKFDGPREYVYIKQPQDVDTMMDLMAQAIKHLGSIAQKHDTDIYIEQDIIPSGVEAAAFAELFANTKRVYLCVDIARLYLQSIVDPAFDPIAFAAAVAPVTRHIHLWNAIPGTDLYHMPIMPNQSPKDGWADIAKYAAVMKANDLQAQSILFEHMSEALTDQELQQCYDYAVSLFEQPK